MGSLQDTADAGGIASDGRPRGSRKHTHALGIPKPVVAAVNGACAGLGFVHAAACDIRFAARGAKFTTSFSRRGLIAEHGLSWTLPRIIGPNRALDVLMSGRIFLAEEAYELGFLNGVVEPDDLMSHTLAYARDMVENAAPFSMATMKGQVYRHATWELDDALKESNKLMAESLTRTDFKEGVASFVEKRLPDFAPLGD